MSPPLWGRLGVGWGWCEPGPALQAAEGDGVGARQKGGGGGLLSAPRVGCAGVRRANRGPRAAAPPGQGCGCESWSLCVSRCVVGQGKPLLITTVCWSGSQGPAALPGHGDTKPDGRGIQVL